MYSIVGIGNGKPISNVLGCLGLEMAPIPIVRPDESIHKPIPLLVPNHKSKILQNGPCHLLKSGINSMNYHGGSGSSLIWKEKRTTGFGSIFLLGNAPQSYLWFHLND